MAESFTSYTLANDKAFKDALDQAKESLTDLRVPFGLISRDFYRSEKAIFQLQGPGQYPPFKKSVPQFDHGTTKSGKNYKKYIQTVNESPYQRRKIKKYGFDYPLLFASGKAAASLLGPSNAGSILLIGNLSMILGSSIDYLKFHQSDRPRKKIPLRKMIFIGPEASQFATSDQMGRLQRWTGYVQDYLDKKLQMSFNFGKAPG